LDRAGLDGDPARPTGRFATRLTVDSIATMATSIAAPPTPWTRLLGLAGILGGAVLLAAFVIEFPPRLNDARLVIFNLGAIAVVVALHRRQVAVSRTLSSVANIAAVVANAWHLWMVVLSIGQANPFAGDFGVVFFYAAMAMWLADAAFGAAALQSGVASRWGPRALTIGSVLAIAGMDRLGLTSATNPTIFGALALTGVALNGLGWILLGLDVASGGRLFVPNAMRGVSRA
jgi:hypothetical protein